ncbi:MAG TPA: QueT transporter family protein [Caldisericia bacterium]|nr:QueT transporter family protein [Caldisericia bacterium]HPF49132.1 QueT transporter family protein [Caldisericia bacterium]HPI83004.1 QueT transporter family protein [Caldisericia bacterium]HPQ92231.1 QueT transporter family protein [Caldisericia bacterium]HRV74671.1 QueT transporter family protein [Caldisericia bacterium]
MSDNTKGMASFFRNRSVLAITRAALIAALYVVLTLPFAIFSYGALQVRLAEVLTILPYFWPEAIAGVTVGCLLANMIGSPFGLVDWVLGTLATFLAALLTYALSKYKNIFIAAIPPVVINALIVGFYVSVLAGFFGLPTPMPTGVDGFSTIISGFEIKAYLSTAAWVGIGQIIAVYGLGIVLYYGLKKFGFINDKLQLTLGNQ